MNCFFQVKVRKKQPEGGCMNAFRQSLPYLYAKGLKFNIIYTNGPV